MLQLIRSLDLWILERAFQPLVIWIHKHTGVGNYAIAKQVFAIVLLTVIASCVLFGLLLHEVSSFSTVVGVLLATIINVKAAAGQRSARNLERHGMHLLANGQLPDLRDGNGHEVHARRSALVYVTFFVPFNVVVFVLDIGSGVFLHNLPWIMLSLAMGILLTGFYFLSCVPPPPSNYRKRERVPASGQFAWSH